MSSTFPGTTIEVTALERGSSRRLFDGIFATGGITLSQVSVMTGLEPYVIQNWVKRGFLSAPSKRVYSKEQFSRIIIINMLHNALQIDRICNLVKIIGGALDDVSDDLISDDELYHRYVDMLSDGQIDLRQEASVTAAAEQAAQGFSGSLPNARQQLVRILEVMLYAHSASKLKEKAEEALFTLQ